MANSYSIILTFYCWHEPDEAGPTIAVWSRSLREVMGPFDSKKLAEKHLRQLKFKQEDDGSWTLHPYGAAVYYEAEIILTWSAVDAFALQRASPFGR